MFIMSSECVKCREKLTHNEDTLECCNCNKNFHYYCVGITEVNFKKMTKNTKSRYTCIICIPELKAVNDPISKLDLKLEDLLKSVSFMGNQFDDFNKKIESALIEMKYIRTENDKIKANNT